MTILLMLRTYMHPTHCALEYDCNKNRKNKSERCMFQLTSQRPHIYIRDSLFVSQGKEAFTSRIEVEEYEEEEG